MRSSAIFFVSVVTRARSPRSVSCRISSIRSSIWPSVGRTSIDGSTTPVGRISCSTIRSLRSSSYGPGVADMWTTWFRWPSNSSNVSGRLSSADGRRNPKSTRISFRVRSFLYIPTTWGIVMCDSSTTSSQSGGK